MVYFNGLLNQIKKGHESKEQGHSNQALFLAYGQVKSV